MFLLLSVASLLKPLPPTQALRSHFWARSLAPLGLSEEESAEAEPDAQED